MIRRVVSHRFPSRRLARSFSTVTGSRQEQSSSTERGSYCCCLAAAAAASVVGTTCFTTSTAPVSSCQEQRRPNPLWPGGISEKDLDAFVDSVLSDPSINMSAIPDAVERTIYKSTVSMTANVIYQAFSDIHGVELLGGHELQLNRHKVRKLQIGEGEHVGIDEAILEQVADRLLSNSAINQTLVPDLVERQLYMNCLKLIFHLLDTMAASFCITVCGHDLRLHFEPSTRKTALTAVSSQTKVDVNELQALARREIGTKGFYGEFQAQLQASLYGLVLGIVDDLLANTEIEMLSDRIGIDVVTATAKSNTTDNNLRVTEQKKKTTTSEGTSVFIPFGLGLGVGAAAMAALFSRRGN